MKHTTSQIALKQAIADSFDRRRNALTETFRVVIVHKDTVLVPRACAMAVPMIYAHWEGYIKEVLQLYIEFLEDLALPQRDVSAALLAYAWSGSFRKLKDNLSHAKQVEITQRLIASLNEVLVFEKTERRIDTRSNLYFDVLEELAQCLCLDISPLKTAKRKLDALVNRRNQIAHGGREQTLTLLDVEEHRELVLDLMQQFESILVSAIDTTAYRRAS